MAKNEYEKLYAIQFMYTYKDMYHTHNILQSFDINYHIIFKKILPVSNFAEVKLKANVIQVELTWLKLLQ